MTTSSSLTGKRALVTGGSRGIGAAIVRRLAADGARVAFTYAASEDAANALVAELTQAGNDVLTIHADSGDTAATRLAVDTAAERFGGLDIVVNNAGIMLLGAVEQVSEQDFDRMIAVNVRASFFTTQQALPHMSTGGGSSISAAMPLAALAAQPPASTP